jgi:hypothetical protein
MKKAENKTEKKEKGAPKLLFLSVRYMEPWPGQPDPALIVDQEGHTSIWFAILGPTLSCAFRLAPAGLKTNTDADCRPVADSVRDAALVVAFDFMQSELTSGAIAWNTGSATSIACLCTLQNQNNFRTGERRQ